MPVGLYMKTILLTSAGMDIKDEILKILPKPANQVKIAHIITASIAKYPVKILTDEQAILVRDNEIKLVGRVEEIKI